MMQEHTIIDGKTGMDEWYLRVVTNHNSVDIEACKQVPYEGTLRHSTEERWPVSSRKDSLYGLAPEDVVERYCQNATASDSARNLLHAALHERRKLAMDTDHD